MLSQEQDFYQLTRDYLARAHADGVVRAECFLGPQSFTDRGVPIQAVIEGTLRAMADAEREDGISAGLLVSAHRHRGEADAFALLDSVLPWADQLAGFGLGGAEIGNPPEKFARYFAELHRLGQPTTAHAGEEGPAAYVRQAVELLGADRIDHGIRVLDDPQLTRELAAAGIPFTVCPISNVKLRAVESLAAHPLPQLLAAGLTVTLNSDDPAYFESSVADNYRQCAQAFELDPVALAGLAADSLRAAFISDEQREPHLSEVAAQLAAVLAEHQSGGPGA